MMIPILEEELIFLDYLDTDNEDFGYKLVDNAPKEAISALVLYLLRSEKIIESLNFESNTSD